MIATTNRARQKTFNYLHFTLGFTKESANLIMDEYGTVSGIKGNWEIGEFIQKDWASFMEYYGTIKETYRKHDDENKTK